jgi:hypothetical protein
VHFTKKNLWKETSLLTKPDQEKTMVVAEISIEAVETVETAEDIDFSIFIMEKHGQKPCFFIVKSRLSMLYRQTLKNVD